MNVVIKKIDQFKSLFKKVNFIYDAILKKNREHENDLYGYKNVKVNLGHIQSHLNLQKTKISKLSEVEFQVFSQFGDDGIIQWLINYLDIENKTFVEFGVEKYIESNTRFLLFNDKWDGLVIDGDENNVNYIKNDAVSYFFNLHSINSFITKDNINELIKSRNFDKELGLLSIDIDGNDYWIWNALENINPVIVISEYNAEFGLNPWTIPYKEDFVWDKSNGMHYWGTSLCSLCDLAEQKGYSFIGCNSQGNNAYFIRNDKMKDLKKLSCEEGFLKAKFSLNRKPNGEQYSEIEKRNSLVGKTVYNTRTNKTELINAL
ncbi:hypothetical protein [Flavobacterium sp. GT3R68]|uniref:hypothetical protein n=1 Tax=Flavobacterium sp. GT3R68 TaxID=2594437 RepID=UPI000F87C042|nr:hypothetical protein [Flavobacterium sp. GT3R68]RTY92276.1 hypothetical protein EKL32_17875 [Flavobacterium sp. GSN2]TRW92512.1 hypothetical protein FNW07_05800 [Flavobacterium sp. GT3R68]